MEDNKIKKCKDCGGKLEMVNRVGSIETYRCERCGREENVHFSIAPDELYIMQKDTLELFVDWQQKDNDLKIIMKLRSLLPEIKKQTIDTIKDLIREGQSYSLGRYYPEQAEELQRSLEGVGLKIRCVK
jgi:predicted nucleic acid-binding Zn ribbon protein